MSFADALDLCLLYRGDPERYERTAARWIARRTGERPGLHLAEIELAATGFREALYSERGVDALRGCLEVGRFGGRRADGSCGGRDGGLPYDERAASASSLVDSGS